MSNKYAIIAWAWTRSKTGNSNLIFVRDGIEEADFPAVFFISQLWDLSSNTDSYKYRSMEIDVSWVEQSTETKNFLDNFEWDSKRPLDNPDFSLLLYSSGSPLPFTFYTLSMLFGTFAPAVIKHSNSWQWSPAYLTIVWSGYQCQLANKSLFPRGARSS